MNKKSIYRVLRKHPNRIFDFAWLWALSSLDFNARSSRMGVMKTMGNVELEENLVERLENGENKDDIILHLCETAGMNWPEAEAMVEQIRERKKNHIVLAQSPVLVLIALVTFLGGAGLATFSAYNILVIFLSYLNATSGSIGAIGMILYLFTYGGYLWGVALLGLGMMIGSLRGMQDIWAAIFEKLGIFQNQ
jgi:hypothetical protein